MLGIYDLYIATNDSAYRDDLLQGIEGLKHHIHEFDCGYWSFYDLSNRIASPFYHNLHIAQLTALSMIDDSEQFINVLNRFIGYQNNTFNRTKAFVFKSIQKVLE